MKKLFLLFFTTFLMAAPTKELSVMDAQVYTNLNQNDSARSYDSNVKEEFNDKVELAINVDFSKNSVKVGEIFYIDVVINSNYKVNFTPVIELKKTLDMQQLTRNINYESQNGVYKARIYLQANTANARLNGIEAKLYRNTELVGESELALTQIKIDNLDFNKNYANLVASELKISNIKCTVYDNESIICGMDAKANNTNFNNFLLKSAKSQSITNVGKDYENARCSIALIFPDNTKQFSFSYFDPVENKFIDFSHNVVVESEEISTQIDLNPITKEINFYMQIGSLVLAVVCLAIVLIFKRFFSLIAVAIIFIAFSFVSDANYSKAVLKKEAIVRILPTHNSTIFYKNQAEREVDVLAKQGGYSKIALDDDTSGWVKDEDLK